MIGNKIQIAPLQKNKNQNKDENENENGKNKEECENLVRPKIIEMSNIKTQMLDSNEDKQYHLFLG